GLRPTDPCSQKYRVTTPEEIGPGHTGGLVPVQTEEVMRNTLCGIFGLSALVAILAVAFVVTDAAAQANAGGQGQGPPFKVACCIQGECGQKTPDHCSQLGGTSLGPRSCAHNPCAAVSTTTTAPATTTTTAPAATTTTTAPAPPTTTTPPAPTPTT